MNDIVNRKYYLCNTNTINMNNIKGCNNVPYAITLLSIGLLYFLLQYNTPPSLSDFSEDLIYCFHSSTTTNEDTLFISNISDIISSFNAHYHLWNGRFANILAPLAYLALSRTQLVVINALMFILLIFLSMKVIGANNKVRIYYALLEASLLFLLMSGFSSTMLWTIGAFNYLWVLVFTLALFLWVRRIISKKISLRLSVFAPLALFVGCGHEGLSLPISIGIIVYILQHHSSIRHSAGLPYLVFYLLGTFLCISSPGIWHRAGAGIPFASRMINGAVALVFSARVLWIFLITLSIAYYKKKVDSCQLKESTWLIIILISAYGIALLNGSSESRVTFYADFISLLCSLVLLHYVCRRIVITYMAILLSLFSLVVYVPALSICHKQKENYLYAKAQMLQPGRTLIKTRIYTTKNKIMNIINNRYVFPYIDYGFYSFYMGFDSQTINMRRVARLYDKPYLIFLPEDIASPMENDGSAFSNYYTDLSCKLMVRRISPTRQVHKIMFVLKPENIAALHIWQRPLSYKGDTYILDDSHWKLLTVSGRRYIVFTTPLTNIKRRIKSIELL